MPERRGQRLDPPGGYRFRMESLGDFLRDADDPSEVSLFVGDSERLRLSRAAFRGAWLSDDDDHDSYLDVDSSGGRPDGNLAFTHQISSVWGVH
jgi:hypothetical protein